MPFDPDFDPKLERLVHEQLRKLPLWKAPDSLAPRVLAAIRKEAARPWWRRDWSQWPPPAKVLFTVLAWVLVVGVTCGGGLVDAQLSQYWQRSAGTLSAFWTSLSPLANAGLLLWTKVFQSMVIYGLVFLAVLYASCLGAGAHERLRAGEFWAVKDVSFELRRGECLGLVGRNGAGKTTLLRMLNGLIKPDAGCITMRGRVGALIALGAGFNPILTGRENIYVNGSVLGLRKREIDAKIEDIIDFADLRESIDSPVRSYSSGMQVRLGFAVATALAPDILLLDEVLAVGDAAFRNKCYRRVGALRKEAAVIFVSHNMDQVARICDRVMVMSRGGVVCLGAVEEGIAAYEKANEEGEEPEEAFLAVNHPLTHFEARLGEAEVVSGAPLEITVRVASRERLDRFLLRVFFYNASGAISADGTFAARDYGMVLEQGLSTWQVRLESVPLKRGRYRLSLILIDPQGDVIVWYYKQNAIVVTSHCTMAIADCQLRMAAWRN